jgi:hypothetical protein
VPSITLDSFLGDEVAESLLIKVDIEGAEWFVFSGKNSFLHHRKAPVAILLETHPLEIARYGGTLAALYARFIEAGLCVRAITRDGLKDFSVNNSPRFWWIS